MVSLVKNVSNALAAEPILVLVLSSGFDPADSAFVVAVIETDLVVALIARGLVVVCSFPTASFVALHEPLADAMSGIAAYSQRTNAWMDRWDHPAVAVLLYHLCFASCCLFGICCDSQNGSFEFSFQQESLIN